MQNADTDTLPRIITTQRSTPHIGTNPGHLLTWKQQKRSSPAAAPAAASQRAAALERRLGVFGVGAKGALDLT